MRTARWVVPVFFAVLVADFYFIFVFAPEERVQGLVQKIFYFHVSSAFAMYGGFLIAGLFAFLFLVQKLPLYFSHCLAGSRVGLLFCTMVLMSGPIWAKPVWGAWWTWDPRLTTTLILWLIFLSALFLHRFLGDDPRGKVYTAVVVLFGVLDIPLVFLSVKLWRGIHPSVLGEEGNMPWEMKLTLMVTLIVVLFFFALLYLVSFRLHCLEERVKVPLLRVFEKSAKRPFAGTAGPS